MELQTDSESPKCQDDMTIPTPWNFKLTWESPQGSNGMKILTPMELQTDLESPQG